MKIIEQQLNPNVCGKVYLNSMQKNGKLDRFGIETDLDLKGCSDRASVLSDKERK